MPEQIAMESKHTYCDPSARSWADRKNRHNEGRRLCAAGVMLGLEIKEKSTSAGCSG
jgi:hypothetical protein